MKPRTVALVVALAGLGVAVALLVPGRPVGDGSGGGDGAGAGALPGRVVTMAPSITECVFALGAGERVIAVTDWCTFPPEARTREKVGGFLNPNTERILQLNPDLVIVQGEARKVVAVCRDRGIPFMRVDMNSVDDVYVAIKRLGERLGRKERARELTAAIRGGLDEVARAVAGRPRPKVFLCTGRRPGSLATLGTTNASGFLSELLSTAGGENIFADAAVAYAQVSKEALLARKPDIVIELRPGFDGSGGDLEKIVAEWSVLPSLPAVANGRVFVLTEDFVMKPGPRMWMSARRMAEVLHPGTLDEPTE